MTIQEALQWGMEKLRAAGVDSPSLDAELLFTTDRAWLYAHGDQRVNISKFRKYRKCIARRAKREPVAYILGHKEFYGLDFFVNKNVLIPRPESELLVDEIVQNLQHYTLHTTRLLMWGQEAGRLRLRLRKNAKCKTCLPARQVQNVKYLLQIFLRRRFVWRARTRE
ncbi:MAG: hypothetical protein Q7S48_01300 [bacterium]|nr:hypothetical protein [bacterium]